MGETVVFTVTLTNSGTANATNVVLTDVIHPKLEERLADQLQGHGHYNAATRVWTVNVGVLAPNETVTVVITGMTSACRVPPANRALPYTITNMAMVRSRKAPRGVQRSDGGRVYFLPGEVPEPGTC